MQGWKNWLFKKKKSYLHLTDKSVPFILTGEKISNFFSYIEKKITLSSVGNPDSVILYYYSTYMIFSSSKHNRGPKDPAAEYSKTSCTIVVKDDCCNFFPCRVADRLNKLKLRPNLLTIWVHFFNAGRLVSCTRVGNRSKGPDHLLCLFSIYNEHYRKNLKVLLGLV